MKTLRDIVLDIHDNDNNGDPLFGILSEFEDMRTKNIIESITIRILVQTDVICCQRDEWGRLDEVLTTPGWFSLKRVSLAIRIGSFNLNRGNNELEVALRNLPQTQLPRLLSSNTVLFDFDVIPL